MIPRCDKCNRSWEPSVPLIFWNDIKLCGDCLVKLTKKESELKRKWIEETEI